MSFCVIDVKVSFIQQWVMMFVPGIIRIHSKGRKSSSFSFRSPESSLSHPQLRVPLFWHTGQKVTGFFRFFCFVLPWLLWAGKIRIGPPGSLQKGQRRKFKKNSQKGFSRQYLILLGYWMEQPEMVHRDSGHCLGQKFQNTWTLGLQDLRSWANFLT